MNNQPTTEQVNARISKGVFKPHIYLTNLALAFFQVPGNFVSKRMFPIVPVATSTAKFYEFDKGDLARDTIAPKPEFGRVAPHIIGKRDHFYNCTVYQGLEGLDVISSLDFQRTNATVDPRRGRVRRMAEKMNIHLDRVWAERYFNPGSWSNVLEGTDSTPAAGQFWYFDNDNCDPVRMFYDLSVDMLQKGLREPNKMCLGVRAYNALRTNPSILERIKFQGSEANPANVNTNVLAQLFQLDEVMVAKSIVNEANIGAEDNMRFICDPDSVLLCYTTDAPSIDEPSAGYTFAWDMLGNGQYMAMQQYLGEPATHTEWIEGLVCTDPRVTSKDLGVFLKNAVSPAA